MTNQLALTLGVWRRRSTARTARDRAYLAYLIGMVTLVSVIPLGRAVWISASSEVAAALLFSQAAPAVASLVVAALWATALLVGRDRGPAIRPPMLAHTLAASGLPAARAFAGPVTRGGTLVVSITTAAAALVAGSGLHTAHASAGEAIAFVGVGVLVGVVTTVAWLVGQALPRTALLLAVGTLVLAVALTAVPPLASATPWGLVGLAYPGAQTPIGAIALTAFAVGVASTVPTLFARLDPEALVAQASQWERATVEAGVLEFAAAADRYRQRPSRARGMPAVAYRRPLWLMVLRRDALAAVRTPGRLTAALVGIVGAAVLVGSAVTASPALTPLVGAAAGVLLFAALGPVSDGMRYAVAVAGDLPLFGVSDGYLVLSHAVFPLLVSVIVLTAVLMVVAVAGGVGAAAPLAGPFLVPLLVVTRIASALKGPLPPALLAPMETPAGDVGAAVRVAWAVDGLLLAALVGAAAVTLTSAPAVAAIATALVTGMTFARWRRR